MVSWNEEYITYGGISIINAIPAWLGGAVAVDLKVRVKINDGPCAMNEFINFIINYLRERLGINNDVCIEVNSEVPPGSGLKSNSAVAVGVIYTLLTSLRGGNASPVEVARLAAEVTSPWLVNNGCIR
ncbi:hypothetical protein [Vulcanisaeta distributa]|uniref:GHMP family kinase ATP-binding protein n=1 Tax=Vulcanisaeta distributa TaxID=164451 RepID=UPI000A6B0D50|nr:hypothetical protein [Vulcanisaeta distributa]